MNNHEIALPHPFEGVSEPTWRFGIDRDGVVIYIFDRDTHEEIAEAHLTYGETVKVLQHMARAANDWKKEWQRRPSDDESEG